MKTRAPASAGALPRGCEPGRTIALSGRGRTFLTVGVICVIAGIAVGVEDLERVGVLLLVLPIPAWFLVRRARGSLQISHSVHPTRTDVGNPAEVRLVLGNPKSFGTGPLRVTEPVPGGLPLRFSVAGIRGGQQRTVAYPLPALPRGRYRIGPTAVSASDPFGLVVAASTSADTAELLVRPTRERLAALALPDAWRDGGARSSHSVGSGGSDDASVREYRYGDDLRKVHWRSSARTGGLMVRQEEQPWHGRSLVLLDSRQTTTTGAGEHASAAFEWAVSAAASLACHLAERGRRVTLVDGSGRSGSDSTDSILDLLADEQPTARSDVRPLADALGGVGRDAAVFAVLAAQEPVTSFGELTARHRRPGSAVAVLTKPWTFRDTDRPDSPELEACWSAAATMLSNSGWRVVPACGGQSLSQLWPELLAASTRIR